MVFETVERNWKKKVRSLGEFSWVILFLSSLEMDVTTNLRESITDESGDGARVKSGEEEGLRRGRLISLCYYTLNLLRGNDAGERAKLLR